MSITYDLDCNGETITLELLDDGTLISYGFNIEDEMIAKEMGFEPHSCFKAMDHALLRAAHRGDINIVELLLAAGADVHAYYDDALRHAALYGYSDVVKLLLEFGADVHAGDNYALRWAVKNGHVDVVAILEDWIKEHGK